MTVDNEIVTNTVTPAYVIPPTSVQEAYEEVDKDEPGNEPPIEPEKVTEAEPDDETQGGTTVRNRGVDTGDSDMAIPGVILLISAAGLSVVALKRRADR